MAPSDETPLPARIGVVGLPRLVRKGLAALLREHGSSAEVVAVEPGALARTSYGIVLWDPSRTDPGHDEQLSRASATGTPVLLVSWQPTKDTVARGVRVGAAGFMPLTLDSDEFLSTLSTVARSGSVAPRRVARATSTESQGPRVGPLSARETEVLTRICAGAKNTDIAEELHLSINSVKTYVRSAYRKIGVERRSQAVIWGARHGLVPTAVTAGQLRPRAS